MDKNAAVSLMFALGGFVVAGLSFLIMYIRQSGDVEKRRESKNVEGEFVWRENLTTEITAQAEPTRPPEPTERDGVDG